CATTAGYGPRFLHSTGQLHKGGPPTGWFLQLTSDHPVDRPIPGWPYTFGRLIDAQAEGDFAAIESHDLPILRVHMADPATGLPALERALPWGSTWPPRRGAPPPSSGPSARPAAAAARQTTRGRRPPLRNDRE